MSYVKVSGVKQEERVLLVTYALRTSEKDYNPFFQALQQQGEWWHFIESTWLISTKRTPQEVYSAVVGNITTSDALMIVPITRPYWGYLPKEAWDWIDKHLPPAHPSGLEALIGPPRT